MIRCSHHSTTMLTAYLAALFVAAAGTAAASLDGNDQLNAQLPADAFQHMGQYSPRYTVPSKVQPTTDLPPGCKVTFVNSLERHGARHLTVGSRKKTAASLAKIQKALAGIEDGQLADPSLGFLRNLTISTETDTLVPYGALQCVDSWRDPSSLPSSDRSLAMPTDPTSRASRQPRCTAR